MNALLLSVRSRRTGRQSLVAALLFFFLLPPALLQAQGARRNPASKVYVADVNGEATIDTGDVIEDVNKRSVYSAEGVTIETPRSATGADRNRSFSTMVYSNGTGAFFDADTRVEMRRFSQEPFTPNRTDMDVEPSISQTQAFVSRGSVGLCNSRLVAGSSMVYSTGLGSVNVRGRKLVIESQGEFTRVSMLEGESTVRGGAMDTGGQTIRPGEQAIIRRGAPGQPNQVVIQPIPPAEMPRLDDQVAMACMARRSVYFETRERTVDSAPTSSTGAPPIEDSSAAGAGADGTAQGGTRGTGSTFNRVTAFDATTSTSGPTGGTVIREIVPVEIVPVTLPVEFTVSTASIRTTPGR
ncbi:MAG: hypothetical protein FJ399_12985 [Verrucomicrobia bacterium]|nr:hypothetical protein [Verrucomicrobiota bacterium]